MADKTTKYGHDYFLRFKVVSRVPLRYSEFECITDGGDKFVADLGVGCAIDFNEVSQDSIIGNWYEGWGNDFGPWLAADKDFKQVEAPNG